MSLQSTIQRVYRYSSILCAFAVKTGLQHKQSLLFFLFPPCQNHQAILLTTMISNEEYPTSFEYDLWIHNNDVDVVMQDEELSASSHEEATKVLEQWQTEEDEERRIMELDEQLGSNLLNDTIFGDATNYCDSPVGPIEELALIYMDDTEAAQIFIPREDSLSSGSSVGSSSVDLSEEYKESLRKLSESMNRSRETRMSLTMKSPSMLELTAFPVCFPPLKSRLSNSKPTSKTSKLCAINPTAASNSPHSVFQKILLSRPSSISLIIYLAKLRLATSNIHH